MTETPNSQPTDERIACALERIANFCDHVEFVFVLAALPALLVLLVLFLAPAFE